MYIDLRSFVYDEVGLGWVRLPLRRRRHFPTLPHLGGGQVWSACIVGRKNTGCGGFGGYHHDYSVIGFPRGVRCSRQDFGCRSKDGGLLRFNGGGRFLKKRGAGAGQPVRWSMEIELRSYCFLLKSCPVIGVNGIFFVIHVVHLFVCSRSINDAIQGGVMQKRSPRVAIQKRIKKSLGYHYTAVTDGWSARPSDGTTKNHWRIQGH